MDPQTTPGALRRRLLRHYLPLAVATGGALAVLVSVPFFDANRYPPPADIFVEGAKGALPDGDYLPTGAPNGADHDGSATNEPGGPGASTPPTTGAPSGHAGPPAGGHGAPTTTPTGGDAGRDAGAAAVIAADHAGNQDTVLRMRRLSTMSGYLAVALIALTLLLGPGSLLLGRRLPVSSYLRRDIGIWAATTSAAHVVLGFLVKHGDGELLGYFFEPGDRSRILTNSFGLANWAGLAATFIVVGLAAISSDAALRKLKARRWKRLQRANCLLAALAVVHAVLYGALLRLTSPYTVTLIGAVVIVAVAQAVGVRLWRRRQAAAPVET